MRPNYENPRMTFPVPPDSTEAGMTLRDWFAGQALVTLAYQINRSTSPLDITIMAQAAYALADAMMKARE